MSTPPVKKYKEYPDNPAGRIVTKFGGTANLRAALENVGKKVHVQTIYMWFQPYEKGGSGGLIPTQMVKWVLLAARIDGVFLEPKDFLEDYNSII